MFLPPSRCCLLLQPKDDPPVSLLHQDLHLYVHLSHHYVHMQECKDISLPPGSSCSLYVATINESQFWHIRNQPTAAGTSLNNNTQKLQLQGSFAGTRIKLWFKNLRIDNRGEFYVYFSSLAQKQKIMNSLKFQSLGALTNLHMFLSQIPEAFLVNSTSLSCQLVYLTSNLPHCSKQVQVNNKGATEVLDLI